MFKLTVPIETDLFAMITEYQKDPAIAYAELNRIYSISDFPNDTDFTKQWALHNTGQTGGNPDADIDAVEAWDIEKGKPFMLIAIVDTGVDYTHPDLAGGRMRTDIDKDFINNDDDAMDDHGHGTYVSGIAAADTNNNRGIAGICQGCQILPVKVLSSEGNGTAETVAQGIQYAADASAKIISMSLGYPSNCGCSQTVARAINYAFERGSLLIAASGNDSDKERISYPASSSRVLSVGASDYKDQEASFSNRSSELDIMAPGKDIYSLDLKGKYRTASGTSAATPHVSGVAGLVWSARPTLSNAQVWWILSHSSDNLPQFLASTSPAFAASELTEIPTGSDQPYKIYLPIVIKAPSTVESPNAFGRLNAYRALTASTTDQILAPVDNCSGEPSCVPGCGAEVALTGEATAIQDLQLLRTFKEDVLTPSPIGQHWVTLYEHHRLEVALILAMNSQLRAQTRSALNQWLPLIQALTNSDSSGSAIITSEDIAVADAVVMGLTAKGSPQLRQDLTEAVEVLEVVRQFVGADVHKAWNELSLKKQR